MSLLSQIESLPTGAVTLTGSAVMSADELRVITDAEIDSHIADVVNKWDVSTLDFATAKALFEYEGFDPKEVYSHMLAKKKAQAISDVDFLQDLFLILTLQHIKGNITPKNISGLKENAQQMVVKIITRYSLQLAIGKEKRRAVTLPRLAAAYPIQMCTIAKMVPKDFSGPHESAHLPSFMKSSGFASVIPTGTDISRFLVLAYTCYTTDMSIALKKMNYSTIKDEQLKAEYEVSLKYADIMFNGTIIDEKAKMQLMTRMDVKSCYEKIKSVVSKVKIEVPANVVPTKEVWDKECDAWAAI